MRQWARSHRGYLIALPLALALGFGLHVYKGYNGNDAVPHRPVDVPKGEQRKLGPITVKFVSVSVKQPQQSSSGLSGDTPENAVVVVARFRGRVDVGPKAAKKIFCESTVENEDGWKWKSEFIRQPYVPEGAATTCDGKRLSPDFKDILPKKGEWFDFYYGYYVPKDKAKGLAPTLGQFREYPEYLRFTS